MSCLSWQLVVKYSPVSFSKMGSTEAVHESEKLRQCDTSHSGARDLSELALMSVHAHALSILGLMSVHAHALSILGQMSVHTLCALPVLRLQ